MRPTIQVISEKPTYIWQGYLALQSTSPENHEQIEAITNQHANRMEIYTKKPVVKRVIQLNKIQIIDEITIFRVFGAAGCFSLSLTHTRNRKGMEAGQTVRLLYG